MHPPSAGRSTLSSDEPSSNHLLRDFHTVRCACYGAVALVQNSTSSSARDAKLCHRIDLLRVTSNKNAYQQYLLDREFQAILVDPETLKVLSPNARKKRLALDSKANLHFNDLSYVPLTDCHHLTAIGRPRIPFSKGKPPDSTFNLGPNN